MKIDRSQKMIGAVLPGNSTVQLQSFDIPTPKHGEVLIETKASTICGSDIRAIYHQHLGKGAEGYCGVIAGHEPCGKIVECGPGNKRFKVGDRVIVYHISGCGLCNDCRRGYMISCSNDAYRKAYGWQRDGGMAPYVLAEEKDLIFLPDELSYVDGAQIACGFGTVYEGLEKIHISGNDAVLVVGLGPVGLASLMLARSLGAEKLIGVDVSPARIKLAQAFNLADKIIQATPDVVEEIKALTNGYGCEKAVECSGSAQGRLTAIQATRQWGRCVMIGEGGSVNFEPSRDIIHDQKTIYGSWVTTIWRMEELVERIVRWGIHPEKLVTHRYPLEQVDQAYAMMAKGECGKIAITF